jgi:uncharacterized UPF0160 family protein
MGEAFLSKLDFYGTSWLPARSIVVEALEKRKELDSKGRILHLPQFCPWKVRILFPDHHSLSRVVSFGGVHAGTNTFIGTFI